MLSRPAFVDRLLARFPDFRSLRLRTVATASSTAGLFGLSLVFAAVQLDARRCEDIARERAETLAAVAGQWLDGDAHAGLGQEPGKRLDDLAGTLRKLVETSEFPGEVRTLRPLPDARAALLANPRAARKGALEVVLSTAEKPGAAKLDYLPSMARALSGEGVVSTVEDGRVLAYAPVPDSWGAVPALVCATAPASAPLWRLVLFGFGATLFAGLLVALAVTLARRSSHRLALQLATLESGVRQLVSGRETSSLLLGRSAPTEIAALAGTLEELRLRTTEIAPAPALADETPEAPPALLGDLTEFDLGLLLQQLSEAVNRVAHVRGVEHQLVLPEGVPTQLIGYPMPLYRALEGLLRNALQSTQQGRITLRVHRASDGGAGERLRFEVADTGPGIPFKEQPALAASIAEAAQEAPGSPDEPVRLASALASALGGQLSFESQPGQGSRFGFTLGFDLANPPAPTAFRQHVPGAIPPESAFVPRARVRAG